MTLEFDLKAIARRGGNLCGEDRFSIEQCAACQGQYLFNAELSDVYYDPEDLSRHYFKIAGIDLPPCRYCGTLSWDFGAAVGPSTAQTGPWAWALASRSFTFSPDD